MGLKENKTYELASSNIANGRPCRDYDNGIGLYCDDGYRCQASLDQSLQEAFEQDLFCYSGEIG